MICWYCHWGWPQEVMEIYRLGAEEAGEMAMDFGPGHVVWADENFDTGMIKCCIEEAQQYREGLTNYEVAVVIRSLNELLAVPEEIRCCEPDDYDGNNPEKFPPSAGLIMVKK